MREEDGTCGETHSLSLPHQHIMAGITTGPIAGYSLHEVIGEGAYGVVHSATDEQTKKKCAIKNIKSLFDHPVITLRTLREIQLLRQLRHENILDLQRVIIDGPPHSYNSLYVVTGLLDSDLACVLANQHLTIEHVRFFAFQLLKGLHHMHAAGVIHRDLKPRNLFVNEQCDLRIGDFGMARTLFNINHKPPRKSNPSSSSSTQPSTTAVAPSQSHAPFSSASNLSSQQNLITGGNLSTSASTSTAASLSNLPNYTNSLNDIYFDPDLTRYVATRWYRAPELLLFSSSYGAPVDMWAVGCIIAEMLLRVPLFRGSNTADQLSRVCTLLGGLTEEDLEAMSASENAKKSVRKIGLMRKQPDSPSQAKYHAALINAGGHIPSEDYVRRSSTPFCLNSSAAVAAYSGRQQTLRSLLVRARAPPDAIDLIEKLLKICPQQRLTSAEALKHPFFKDLLSPTDLCSFCPPNGLPRITAMGGSGASSQGIDVAQLRIWLVEEVKKVNSGTFGPCTYVYEHVLPNCPLYNKIRRLNAVAASPMMMMFNNRNHSNTHTSRNSASSSSQQKATIIDRDSSETATTSTTRNNNNNNQVKGNNNSNHTNNNTNSKMLSGESMSDSSNHSIAEESSPTNASCQTAAKPMPCAKMGRTSTAGFNNNTNATINSNALCGSNNPSEVLLVQQQAGPSFVKKREIDNKRLDSSSSRSGSYNNSNNNNSTNKNNKVGLLSSSSCVGEVSKPPTTTVLFDQQKHQSEQQQQQPVYYIHRDGDMHKGTSACSASHPYGSTPFMMKSKSLNSNNNKNGKFGGMLDLVSAADQDSNAISNNNNNHNNNSRVVTTGGGGGGIVNGLAALAGSLLGSSTHNNNNAKKSNKIL